tara:strand:- start:458 stop:715 length:258 start_codon:yes stop_codon:yes gene_type:complete
MKMTRERIKEFNELNDKLIKASKKFIFTAVLAVLLIGVAGFIAVPTIIFWIFLVLGIVTLGTAFYFSTDAIHYSWKFYRFDKKND